jgi:hypothetical protein
MPFLRVFDHTRILTGLVLVALFAFNVGCDSGGGGGESAATPPTPPPGKSAADQAKARANAYPAGGAAAKKATPAPATK